jgi:hypothetical protein
MKKITLTFICIFSLSVQYLYARTFADPGVKLEGVTINSTANVNTQNVVKNPDTSLNNKIETAKSGSIKLKVKKYPKGKITGSPHNSGIAGVGDWVYFRNANDNDKLYKMMNDGTKKTKICDDKAYSINIVNEYIYYTNGWEGNIFRIKTDGSGRTQLNKEDSSAVKVAGGWIYYQHPWGYNRDMKKMKLDGSDVRTVTSDGYCAIYCIAGDWIYYFGGLGELSKVKTDGSGKQVALRINYIYLNIEGEWVYFTNIDRNRNICRINLNGSNFSEINNEESSSINVFNGWIYYSNQDDGDKLYKIKTDGSQKTKLADDQIKGIEIAADWIYYGSQNKLYRAMLDGSNRQLIE